MEEKNHLSIRTDKEVHDKFRYIAAYEGRSMSGQILYLINTCIREFEKEHGPIRLGDQKEEQTGSLTVSPEERDC